VLEYLPKKVSGVISQTGTSTKLSIIAHVPGLATLGDSITLKAVYSRSEKSAKELADEAHSLLGPVSANLEVYHDADPTASLDVLLARPDIDAVIVILPITTQPDIIIRALKAGKHVISEKPVAADVASGLTLIKTYLSDFKPKGLIWRVAENFEAEPGIRAIGQAIRDGKIGKVTHFAVSAEYYMSKGAPFYCQSG
jgi:predicted dehydrogenase